MTNKALGILSETIDLFNNAVIQIATPYSTGTGFYLSEFDLIVTNEHVVRENLHVVLAGENIEKAIVDVLYVDPLYDLAFLAVPEGHKLGEVALADNKILKQGMSVLAVGHPYGLKYTATQGIISNLLHEQKGINYIQHDAALNPGNSGGPLISNEGRVIGVNTFIIKDGNNIGFSLPYNYLRETLKEFVEGNGKPAVRCNSCLNLVFDEAINIDYCPHCGSEIRLIKDIDPYIPTGISKTIEDMLITLGYNTDMARRGPDHWEVQRGSAKINISYYHKNGLIVGDAYLCSLPKANIKELYTFLLRQNYELESLVFSVKGQDVIISLLIYDQYLNLDTCTKLMQHLMEKADHYDDILIDQYGALKKNENNLS